MRRPSTTQSLRFRRRGITIIEVLIAATAVSLLISLCAVSIQLLMKLNADVQGRFSAAVTLERLARQVRDDAHASDAAQVVADKQPASLRLRLEADHVVEYQSGDGGVVRTESRAGKVIRHETYVLARGGVGQFELRDEGSHKMVALVVTHAPAKSQTEPPRALEVLALRGKDRPRPPVKEGETPR